MYSAIAPTLSVLESNQGNVIAPSQYQLYTSTEEPRLLRRFNKYRGGGRGFGHGSGSKSGVGDGTSDGDGGGGSAGKPPPFYYCPNCGEPTTLDLLLCELTLSRSSFWCQAGASRWGYIRT